MRRALLTAIGVGLGISGGSLLGGCGSSTKTVSVAGAPTTPQTSTGGSSGSTAPRSPSTAGTAPPTATDGGTAAPTTTRTASEPAFVQQGGGSSAEGVSAAAAVLGKQGFTPNDTSDYHPNQTLRVLVGTRAGSGNRYDQRAFFFVGGRYIGTDSSAPSATLRVLEQGDTQVTLAYPLYRKDDSLCCPSAGQARVTFQLDNGMLTPLQPIPSASAQAQVSRR